MKTKTFALLVALFALAFGVAACGGGGGTTAADTGSNSGASSGSDSNPPKNGKASENERAEVPTIVVENGEPVGGVAELEFDAGEQVRFWVRGDEAEEIHVHGYDLAEEIPQGGGTVEFDFPAEIEGIFEAELEGKGEQILELRVNP